RRETADSWTLDLEPADEGPGMSYLPGQFNMIYAFGVGEAPISISGDPSEPGRLLHTVRTVGTVTRALRRLRPGDHVGVRGPFGTAWPVQQLHGHDVVVLAGGIGLAPLRPAILHLLARRAEYGHVAVLYGARSPRDILYPRDLRRWRGRFDVEVEVTVDRASHEWQGPVGVVTRLVERAPFDPSSTVALVCGPEAMIRFGVGALEARGVDASSLYVSLERNMKCAIGLCGHCQMGPVFVCRDGPVFPFGRVRPFFGLREV
ncbi:MAG TPA: FAD/NAD(P)-binding protein, partial [Vicinamibacteria bacterium]|nr:FAD/NAD(P)-binding protein [Vicinamibacteria bacterium]